MPNLVGVRDTNCPSLVLAQVNVGCWKYCADDRARALAAGANGMAKEGKILGDCMDPTI